MKHTVYNNSIGAPYGFQHPTHSEAQKLGITAALFEQLLIFDKVTISTNRLNSALVFLLQRLGLETVERLAEAKYIDILIWTPMIFTSTGTKRDDGTIDESTMMGQPPLGAGTLSKDDLNPEHNITIALKQLGIDKTKSKVLIKKLRDRYIVPNGMEFSTNSAGIVIDAYKNNTLKNVGLPFEKAPEDLNKREREIILELAHTTIETALLSKYGFKSFDNYDHFEICKQNIENIGKAYKVTENSSKVFELEKLPDLKTLFIDQRFQFDSIFKVKHLSNAKYYRKWINEVGENANGLEISQEYINQIKGTNKFFETTKGKFLKNLTSFAVGTALGAALENPIAGGAAGYGLGLLDTFWIDSLLKGKNPSMFIEDVKKEIGTISLHTN